MEIRLWSKKNPLRKDCVAKGNGERMSKQTFGGMYLHQFLLKCSRFIVSTAEVLTMLCSGHSLTGLARQPFMIDTGQEVKDLPSLNLIFVCIYITKLILSVLCHQKTWSPDTNWKIFGHYSSHFKKKYSKYFCGN